MKDYYATIKIQQGRLKSAMIEKGIKSVADLARRSGVSMGSLHDLLNFRMSYRYPDCKKSDQWRYAGKAGEWRRPILDVCNFLGYSPSELFPEHLDKEIATNRIESFVDQNQIEGVGQPKQLTPYEDCANEDRAEVLDAVLDTLTEREKKVLTELYFKENTRSHVGRNIKVCSKRVSDIEWKALRKLRHPSRMNKLKEVYTT